MRLPFLMLVAAGVACAQPHVDNVLMKMVPPGTTSLVSAHMDQIKATDFYRKLVEQQKLPQVDQFAAETGFDPRRDVREVLYASSLLGSVMLARGTFNIRPDPLKSAKLVRHGEYIIQSQGNSGLCILDRTLAAAGELPMLEAALDEWKSGKHTAAQPLLGRAAGIDSASQFWGVSTGFAGFLADHMPRSSSGIDFSRIFSGLQDTWFDAAFVTGFKGQVHGTANAEQDAINLRDAAKGLVGFGRLSVPENHPEMLKLWDGITVDQQGRTIAIKADIPQVMVDDLVRLMQSAGRGAPRVP
ncbi:MAG: hypothetical protein M3N54_12640 [Acidobacteriota bacterium]|nr:hypothetical protein [Acidobacteriota bacterium]